MKKITAVKLNKWDGKLYSLVGCAISYFEKIYNQDGEFSHIENTDKDFKNYFVSDDLLLVFQSLSRHMACILELEPMDHVHADIISVTCNSIMFKGEEENEGIIMTGTKLLKSGLTLNLVTPLFVFATQHSYENIEELYETLQSLNFEATQVIEKKKQRIVQMEMSFAEAE